MDNFLWVEKYRPKTVQETILPKGIKERFQSFVDNGEIPNLILSGSPGCGKTTAAKAMIKEIGADHIVINGSLNGNIDTLRDDIQQFASTVSLAGGRKYVILDEADYLNARSTQPALRSFMEQFSKNCGFIMTCNYKNRIIDALQSRCSLVEFHIPKEEKPKLAAKFFKRACYILDDNNVSYDQKSVAALINNFFPDWRKVLNTLQDYSSNGNIDEGVLSYLSDSEFDTLFKFMKDKNFSEMRHWVATNFDVDSDALYDGLYQRLSDKMKSTSSVADAIVILAQYQFQEAFVANSEINRVAALATLMAQCDWK